MSNERFRQKYVFGKAGPTDFRCIHCIQCCTDYLCFSAMIKYDISDIILMLQQIQDDIP